MDTIIKHVSRNREYTENSNTHKYTILGDCSTIFTLQDGTYAIGNKISGMGTVKSTNLKQEGGDIWALEITCYAEKGGVSIDPPDTSFGTKSATLDGSMLSMPLESHTNYETRWNHFLFAHPNITTIPAWWATAKDPILSEAQSKCYAWGKELSDIPVIHGEKWLVMKKPTKPGVQNYDIAVYTVTESARFATANAAGAMVKGKLNQISAPDTTFGITGGNWKCDHATISFTKYWLATLTWTHSATGWDPDIY